MYFEFKAFQYDALACNHVVRLAFYYPFTDEDRSNAVWVSEANDSETCEHGNTSVCALDFVVHFLEAFKDIFSIDTNLACVLERGGKYVEKKFGIGIRVNVTMNVLVEESFQIGCICQISILSLHSSIEKNYVSKDNSIRRIDIEGLGFGVCGTSSRRISH